MERQEDAESSRRDDEADRLWLGRAISSPDAWRGRATNAAGLLSAAAAATVAALLFHPGPGSQTLRLWSFTAAVGYIAAVVAYLCASVWPSPNEDLETEDLAEAIWDYCLNEARPIKRLALGGTLAAVVAIVATGGAIYVSVQPDVRNEGQATVAIVSSRANAALAGLCPGLTTPFDARVEGVDSERLRVELPAAACGSNGVALVLRRDDVVLKLSTGP